MELILGTSVSIGLKFTALLPERMQPIMMSALKQARDLQRAVTQDWEIIDQGGRISFFETVFNPLRELGNTVCLVTREMTSEKVFQKKVVHLAQDLSSLIENANAVIFSIDSRQYVTEWNAECARITQHTKNEVLTNKIGSFVDQGVAHEFDTFLASIYAGNPGHNFELKLRTKDGNVITLLLNATPKKNAENKVIGILFVGQDITELSEYKSSLERIVKDRTSKLKEALKKEKELVEIRNRFVSMASHELRIPLSMISSSAKTIRAQADNQDSLASIHAIEKQVNHMRSLIADVLTVAKTDVTNIKAVRNHLDIVGFISKLSEEVCVNTNHTHRVLLETSEPVVELESDEKLLRNVFLNLLSNAIKFSPGKEKIEVAITRPDGHVLITVKDYGIGISEEDLARVFEPFTRGSNAAQIDGTGLGLSIVKRAVEALNGSIEMTSSVGVGTVTKVKFYQ
ncbi:MAG TPA: PAS domain-containing sensor histidine kinase [Chryseosolibacter sp.]